MPLRLLGVFAHAIDGPLLSGGVLAGCAAEGAETMVLYAASAGAEPGAAREAARALQVPRVVLLDYEAGRLDGLAPSTLTGVLRDVYRSFQPHVVVTLASEEGPAGDPDHLAVHRAASAAFHQVRRSSSGRRPAPLRLYYAGLVRRQAEHLLPRALAGRVPCPGPWSRQSIDARVTAVVDVRRHLEAKLRALATALPGADMQDLGPWLGYESFARAFPEPWVSGVVERALLAGIRDEQAGPPPAPGALGRAG